MRRASRWLAAVSLVATAGLSACSGGGDARVRLSAVSADSGMVPGDDGFSFANFPANATSEWFNEQDLVTMFGASACVDGVTDPCTPVAQAAQWAQMVNEARLSGHCEGLAVQSAVRFTQGASPRTVELKNEGDVTHGIMRAFATQFFPEVQKAAVDWSKKSLNEILNELSRALTAKDVSYTMGLYTPTGGHAVLPYAVEFPSKDLAVVKVYDSNWPGMERYVVVDLAAQVWYFSFSGTDPQKDECAWSGKAGDIDLAPMSARTEAQCPFCGDDTKVAKTVLLIRSASLDWSLKTAAGTYTPATQAAVADVRARAIRTATCEQTVRIPEFVLYTEAEDFELELPDTSSAYVATPDAVVRVVTEGRKRNRAPIVFADKQVSVKDDSTSLTVAADNVVARVQVPDVALTVGENLVSIETGGTTVEASPEAPQIQVTAPATGGAPKVEETKDLVTVVPKVVQELVPDEVKPGLSAASTRDLSNETYVAAVATVATVPISIPPVTTTTTLAPTTTQAATTTAAATTTTRATTTTVKSTTTTAKPGTPTVTQTTTVATTTLAPTTTANNRPPTVTITRSGSGTVGGGQDITITFTLSEPSTNFAAGDVTVSSGALTGFSGSGTSYSANWTPPASGSGTASISVAANKFTDSSSSSNTASTALSIVWNANLPSVDINRSGSGIVSLGEDATVTFTLSEPATNFTAGDVTVSAGTLSGFAGSGTAYTATWTPPSSSSGTASISVAANKFTDSSGNNNTAATPLTITYNTVPPTTTAAPTTTASPTTTIHPYLQNYGCPYVYVGPSYDGSTGMSGVNTEATGRCNAGWEDIEGTVTFEGTTRTINYSYQFRTCATVTYSLRVRFSNGTRSQYFNGSYTPPQNNC